MLCLCLERNKIFWWDWYSKDKVVSKLQNECTGGRGRIYHATKFYYKVWVFQQHCSSVTICTTFRTTIQFDGVKVSVNGTPRLFLLKIWESRGAVPFINWLGSVKLRNDTGWHQFRMQHSAAIHFAFVYYLLWLYCAHGRHQSLNSQSWKLWL